MNRHQRIKRFVQQDLGCTCPDNVFEQIEEAPASILSDGSIKAITIGGKLLIYIWHVEGDLKGLQENLTMLLQAGRKARDENGLNRFRAVLVTEDPHALELPARLCFSQYEDRDERLHLHVIARDLLRDL